MNKVKADLDVLQEMALAMAQATMQNAMNKAHLSRAEIARQMGCSKSFVTRILGGGHNLTVRTFARVLGICGTEVEFQSTPVTCGWSDVPHSIASNLTTDSCEEVEAKAGEHHPAVA